MAELNKGQLTAENTASFPNNTVGYITPDLLRTFNQNMIDSLVDEVTYNADSASVSASIAQLKGFSASLDNTYATDAQLNYSSSVLQGNINVVSSSVGELQSWSSSLDLTYATDAQLSASASTLQNQINLKVNISQTSSMSVLSSSYAVTSSYALQALTASYAGNVPETASYAISSSQAITASFLLGSIASASYASFAETASFLLGSVASSSYALSSSFASFATSASYSTTASFALNVPATASFAISASYALTSSEARNVVIIARNGNASSLPAGTVVHITGASGDNPIFNTASYDSELLSANTLGILRTTATSGADVEVLVNGIVTGVNTDPANGYVAGDIIYLGPTGSFTRVQPQAPLQIVTLGQVLRAQQNNGSIYVSITNGWELNELHNVAINNPTEGDLLVYRSGSYGLWTNSSSVEIGNATTGSNTFKDTQTIDLSATAILTASAIIGNADKVITDMYVNGGNYDTFNVLVSASNGVFLRDFNGVDTTPFLSVDTNGGNVRIPRSTNLTGSLIVSGGFNAKVAFPLINNTNNILQSTGSIIVAQDIVRQGGGASDVASLRLQARSGSAGAGDALTSTITAQNNLNTTTFLSASAVASVQALWATGSGGGTVSYTAGLTSTAQSGSAISVLSGNTIRLGTSAANVITSTGSFGPMVLVGTLNQPVLAVRSGSVEVTTPQGSGSFYSNLPITSSNLRINGTAIVKDLIVSGTWGGTGSGSLQVENNASVSGNLFVSGVADISSISASKGLSITGSLPTIQSGSLSGSLIGNLGSVYTASIIPQNVVGIGSASMAYLLSTGGTTPNTLYFVI